MWGQVHQLCGGTLTAGIIPTRVGTRGCQSAHSRTEWDHPHACGDKSKGAKRQVAKLGSSPRVWGQEANFPDMYDEHRIIPTRVGTSSLPSPLFLSFLDHPHACGDKPPWRYAENIADRIIPTRVGTSCSYGESS